jgi:amino acid permease
MEVNQHELYEYARKRIKQKKRLYLHFIIFILGSIFLFVSNNWLNFYPDRNWWIWIVSIWVFIFLFHLIKVFVTDSFMNKNWERTQIDKLILKQNKKIEQLKNDLDNTKSTNI